MRGVVFCCDETILDPPAFLHHLSEITDILYLRISGRSCRIASVAITFCKQVSPKLCNFFYHHCKIWLKIQRRMEMPEPLLTIKDWWSFCGLGCCRWSCIFSERMAQESLQTSTNARTVSSNAQYFWRLISKTCCSRPLLGPTFSLKVAVLQLRWYGMGNEHQDRNVTLSRQNTGSFFLVSGSILDTFLSS